VILVGTFTPSGVRQLQILLPHQLYRRDVTALRKESGTREVMAAPIFSMGGWREIPRAH
jgi:hypothetical protein